MTLLLLLLLILTPPPPPPILMRSYIVQNALVLTARECASACCLLCATSQSNTHTAALCWQSPQLVYKISTNALDTTSSFLSQITYFTKGLNCSLRTRYIAVSSQIKDTKQLIIFIKRENVISPQRNWIFLKSKQISKISQAASLCRCCGSCASAVLYRHAAMATCSKCLRHLFK